jgi:hypothetical protein
VNRRRVPNIELSWLQAAVAAGALIAVAVELRLARRPRLTAIAVFTQETALVLGLFALWQFAGSFSVLGRTARCRAHAGSGTSNGCCTCRARPACSGCSCRIR